MAGARGVLTIVATPIGNLEDLSPRAVRSLAEAGIVLAEDTRRARALLSHLGIRGKRVERLDAHLERHAVDRWVDKLADGEAIALVTDAGTPAVSDPGAALVRAAAERGVVVVPIPGPSAVIAALAASGMPADRFRFFGFLPRKGTARKAALSQIVATLETVVFFESPQRVQKTLCELALRMPAREAVVARELTKLHEELVRATLAVLAERSDWRGELTIVLAPHAINSDAVDVDARLHELLAAGMRAKDAAKTVADEAGISARELYARIVSDGRQPTT